ncbi:MAG: zinc-ribbon domain-containing protein [Eggerthellaceae bacterium]|nr:zinc-ribbon domain-containing protein [Eggerthellaceae bacterium]
MCFRPPSIDLDDVPCSQCGAKVPAGAKECPECGAPQALNAAVAPPSVPSMGGIQVPGGVKPPVAPGTPQAPGAPKPPTAPGN